MPAPPTSPATTRPPETARGNPANLRVAAQRKHHAAPQPADTAVETITTSGGPISFPGLARAVARLEAALATAQGENLELRRRLGRSAPGRQLGDPKRREPQAGDFIEPAPPAHGAVWLVVAVSVFMLAVTAATRRRRMARTARRTVDRITPRHGRIRRPLSRSRPRAGSRARTRSVAVRHRPARPRSRRRLGVARARWA